jgi:hypothetical protein
MSSPGFRIIQSEDIITVDPGCYVHTMEADRSETVEINIKCMDWASELANLSGRGNTEIIHQAIQDLRIEYNSKFDASTLFMKLDHLLPPEAHWMFTSPAAMIWIALTIFIIRVLFLKNTGPPKMVLLCPCHLFHLCWPTRPPS